MFLSGNQCIAHGVRLSRVEVISAYPITPATPASEELHEMVARGELDADIVNVESELGAAEPRQPGRHAEPVQGAVVLPQPPGASPAHAHRG